MNAKQSIPLYLFAKAPEPNQVKTRMQPSLSPQHSAELAAMMLEDAMSKVSKYWEGEKILATAPDIEHPTLQTLATHYEFRLEEQVEGDLGIKIWHVLEQGMLQSGGVVVLGSDVPLIPDYVIRDTYQYICQGTNVVGPTLDGGFYLLGLTSLIKGIFANIQWSTGSVYDSLKRNTKSSNIQLTEHPILRDIDNIEDLQWLADQDARYQKFMVENRYSMR
ncbi:MAG: TIGR04282 family arsenosugar biosynthesis glycosyltransferase [Gammaproteobacteria bacterium]|nr:TIGR04282 family arsenosugar biosynthesis glycosyltransferase [Gammaproteobacteria bacterium]MCY4218109.1 TIGR04282 family arsenosugar biosynthesis glycosyltransferase [Gammaproteobacteria bacterium]MCY4274827.1 TIGR04282 family arsenosugar biosynthesis glycosyltransferase [Gammaproteobacteria bacterium]